MDLELDDSEPGALALVAKPRAPDDAILPFLCEELFASTLMLCRGLVGASFRPLRLELAYPAPAYAQEYEELFECEVRFGLPGYCHLKSEERRLGKRGVNKGI